MQAYEGYLEDGRFFSPLGTLGAGTKLKGRQKVIMTLVEDVEADETRAKREAAQKLWSVLMEAEREAEEKGWLTKEQARAIIEKS